MKSSERRTYRACTSDVVTLDSKARRESLALIGKSQLASPALKLALYVESISMNRGSTRI